MESLTLQYPVWYLFFCALIGLIGAGVIYFRDNSFKDQSPWLRNLLSVLRFASLFFIALLLLEPLLKSLISETKKPIIVMAQDQSQSIGSEMKEPQQTDYRSLVTDLSSQLGEHYELKEYAFGEKVREGIDFKFEDKVSDLAGMMQSVYDNYSNQNLGAVVVATDGIYNKGSNPLYSGIKLSVPIFTVALGDTTPKRDLLIKRVFNNKIVYLGDKFNIQADIAALNGAGANTKLVLSRIDGDKTIKLREIPISINKNDFFTTRELVLNADEPGVQRFRLSLTKIPGEATGSNNYKDIFIDVLDARQKILILANAPHPDVSAIRQSLEKSKNYEVAIGYAGELKKKVEDFDFVIMHQLPSLTNPAKNILSVLSKNKTPRLFIVGMQSDFRALSNLQPFLTISGDNKNTNDVQASVATDFNLFTISDQVRDALSKFAPLTAPFGDFKEIGNGQTLLYQRIAKIDTKYPLLTLGETGGIRTGILAAEGLYKWKLFDYLQNQNHDIFEEIFGKTIQYLSLKEDKRKFRISHAKNIYNENEPVIFDAELYNENFELINDPDATVTVKSTDGKSYPFTFNKSGKNYSLNVGIFPVGNYSFSGSVISAGQKLDYAGRFSVQPVQLESYETTADHGLLKLIAEKSGGELLYPGDLPQLKDILEARGTVKPVIYNTSKTRSVINLKWIFFALFLLLGIEWFLRRYFGSY